MEPIYLLKKTNLNDLRIIRNFFCFVFYNFQEYNLCCFSYYCNSLIKIYKCITLLRSKNKKYVVFSSIYFRFSSILSLLNDTTIIKITNN